MSKSEYIQALKDKQKALSWVESEGWFVLQEAIELAGQLEEWWEHQDRKLSE